jgi:hypothetical protein
VNRAHDLFFLLQYLCGIIAHGSLRVYVRRTMGSTRTGVEIQGGSWRNASTCLVDSLKLSECFEVLFQETCVADAWNLHVRIEVNDMYAQLSCSCSFEDSKHKAEQFLHRTVCQLRHLELDTSAKAGETSQPWRSITLVTNTM